MKKVLFIALIFVCTYLFPQAPSATITVGSATICANKAITFSCTTTNTPTAFTWNTSPSAGVSFIFGNSSPSVAISFQNSSVVTVSLTVSNVSGTVTTTQTIRCCKILLPVFRRV